MTLRRMDDIPLVVEDIERMKAGADTPPQPRRARHDRHVITIGKRS